MNKKIRVILLSAIILTVLTLLFISSSIATKKPDLNVEIDHTWTKAICNSDNYCQDYEISCYDNTFVKMTPTGAAIHFSESWRDPRTENLINKLC
jgi:hypothetical protein